MTSAEAYEKVSASRGKDRPTAKAYISGLFRDAIELHGDRNFGDDHAIIGGLGYLDDIPVTFIGIEKGSDINERVRCNFGSPKPEGYRKALRLMKQAEKFHRPVVCFVDTAGAFCGEEAEMRGQGQAIANNLAEMMELKTPVITFIIGEGGSGGALGLAVADRVYMLSNSVYSVISPEGCASILWKDESRVADAAKHLHITAEDMVKFGVAEEIIQENFVIFPLMLKSIKTKLVSDINSLMQVQGEQLQYNRYSRFRKLGKYIEK